MNLEGAKELERKNLLVKIFLMVILVKNDSRTLAEAMFWNEAVKNKFNIIMQTYTWYVTNLQPGWKALGIRWIFKQKLNSDGTIGKYKAMLVI